MIILEYVSHFARNIYLGRTDGQKARGRQGVPVMCFHPGVPLMFRYAQRFPRDNQHYIEQQTLLKSRSSHRE